MSLNKSDNTLDIAIIGMAGRFPGANNLNEFWKNLIRGEESITFLSEEEIKAKNIDPELVKDPNYVNSIGGEILNYENFDAEFFGYTEHEAQLLEPQLRIFHECFYHAFEDAGYVLNNNPGVIGIYTGVASTLIWETLSGNSDVRNGFDQLKTDTFINKDFFNSILSYKFNLNGPSISLNTACSTSLVALHLACQGLLSGDCNIACAGGVAINLNKGNGYLFAKNNLYSNDGHCRAFDKDATGIVGSDGVGLVVIKRLNDAIKDNDHIYAVIKGTSINNDGNRKVGYSAPSIEGQSDVIRRAHWISGVKPQNISYIETHGTGTPLGDLSEIEALKDAFNVGQKQSCAIGSVKTNIGHTSTAAGIAGLIKTSLSLYHKQIPPSINFNNPNPLIDFKNSPFYVNSELKNWKSNGKPLTAGVSSFGIGGTNAHVILEEMPYNPTESNGREYLQVLLSARSETALKQMKSNLIKYIENNPDVNLADLCYTLKVGREEFPFRQKLICNNIETLVDKLLSGSDSRKIQKNQVSGKPQLVFVFPGIGSQYINMGIDIYKTEKDFKEEIDHCFKTLEELTGKNYIDFLYPVEVTKEIEEGIKDIEIAQYVTFIFEYCLTKLLQKWGIDPDFLIGYSFGEYVAASISGLFDLRTALKIIVKRSEILKKHQRGKMLSIPLPLKEVEKLLTQGVHIGIDNGESIIVSGSVEDINEFEKVLKAEKIITYPVDNTYAFHSKNMDPICQEFTEYNKKQQFSSIHIPFISNLTGTWINSNEIQPDYWSEHMANTVKFSDGINELLKKDNLVFLEIGAGRDISSLIQRNIENTDNRVLNLVKHANQKISDAYFLQDKIGDLWLAGISIDWLAFYKNEERKRISLPGYPFESKRYWKLIDDYLNGTITDINKQSRVNSEQEKGFYILNWKREKHWITKTENFEKETWLLFADNYGIGDALVKHLELKIKPVIVKKGIEYNLHSDNTYIIDPGSKDEYEKLFSDLHAKNIYPDKVIHLWGIENEVDIKGNELNNGIYSVLEIAKLIGKESNYKNKVTINIVSNNLYSILGTENIEAIKATILGGSKVIPQEYPGIACKSIDIQFNNIESNPQDLTEILTKEISIFSGESTVAYRNGQRWIPVYKKIELPEKHEQLLIKENGVYIIFGGLGNIGFWLSEYILQKKQAKVILVNRTEIPKKEFWEQLLLIGGEDTEKMNKIKRLSELSKISDNVEYYYGDISDSYGMKEIFNTVEKKYGKVNGIIHAAGILDNKYFKTIEEIKEEDFQEHFQAKIKGLQIINEIIKDKDMDFSLVISSISSILGGLGFVAYTAANAFIDAFVLAQNQNSKFRWITVNWDGTEKEETVSCFAKILMSDNIEQIIYSARGSLEKRISQWLNFSEDKETITSSNKSDENYLKQSTRQITTPYVAPSNDLELKLSDIWQKFFGIEKIGVDDDLFDLGADSLKAINILSILHKEINISIPLKDFFNNPSIRGISKYIQENTSLQKNEDIIPAEKKEYYDLSSAQKRSYILQELDGNYLGHNSLTVNEVEGDIDISKFEDVINTIIKRHEILRTSIIMVNNEPFQRVSKNAKLSIDIIKMKENEIQSFIESEIKPFDFNKAPLMRASLIKTENNKNFLLWDMHHSITDAVSRNIFITEFVSLYNKRELPEQRLHYKDYSEWQKRKINSEQIKKQEEYWIEQFKQEPPLLNLPIDLERGEEQKYNGNSIKFELSTDVTNNLRQLASQEGTTLFMVLLSVNFVLLHKLTNGKDIIIGTAAAGRNNYDLEQILGMFVNLLPLRNTIEESMSFQVLLKNIKNNTLLAFQNQEYQLEQLLEKVLTKRELNRNPLFDFVFNFHSYKSSNKIEHDSGDNVLLNLKQSEIEYSISRFELLWEGFEKEDSLFFNVTYATNLYHESTIRKFVDLYIEIIDNILKNKQLEIHDINLSSDLNAISNNLFNQIDFDF